MNPNAVSEVPGFSPLGFHTLSKNKGVASRSKNRNHSLCTCNSEFPLSLKEKISLSTQELNSIQPKCGLSLSLPLPNVETSDSNELLISNCRLCTFCYNSEPLNSSPHYGTELRRSHSKLRKNISRILQRIASAKRARRV